MVPVLLPFPLPSSIFRNLFPSYFIFSLNLHFPNLLDFLYFSPFFSSYFPYLSFVIVGGFLLFLSKGLLSKIGTLLPCSLINFLPSLLLPIVMIQIFFLPNLLSLPPFSPTLSLYFFLLFFILISSFSSPFSFPSPSLPPTHSFFPSPPPFFLPYLLL